VDFVAPVKWGEEVCLYFVSSIREKKGEKKKERIISTFCFRKEKSLVIASLCKRRGRRRAF